MAKAENIKSITVRCPEPIHRKLRMLAAMRGLTMSDTLLWLIESAKIENPDDVATVQSLLYGASAGIQEPNQGNQQGEQQIGRKTKAPKRKPKIQID
ncbi:uncharacterized protein Dvar_56590 [Desulfosarcina variabilis str. Montpellier]|uniref:hypothetical protein n=1 Tax=Desulfosarcina variabilis TaxID=2300 RepID=UPI003AFB25D7